MQEGSLPVFPVLAGIAGWSGWSVFALNLVGLYGRIQSELNAPCYNAPLWSNKSHFSVTCIGVPGFLQSRQKTKFIPYSFSQDCSHTPTLIFKHLIHGKGGLSGEHTHLHSQMVRLPLCETVWIWVRAGNCVFTIFCLWPYCKARPFSPLTAHLCTAVLAHCLRISVSPGLCVNS